MDGRCVIISGGEYSPFPPLRPEDYVIACDRGWAYARQEGVRPDLIVGDFDSYTGPVPEDIPVLRFGREKDDTDTMIAVKYAIAQGFDEICLFCALGGRLDHSYANIQSAVYAAERDVRASILSADTRIYMLKNTCMDIRREDDFSLSLFAMSDRCEGVSVKGVKYELSEATLTSSFPLGVSNRCTADTARVRVRSGILMVMQSRLR